MRKLFLTTFSLMAFGISVFAADVQYNIQIDGITCPSCVKTSAKALIKIDGVKEVGSDLEKGLIKICADERTTFTDEKLRILFLEKGFIYSSMEKQEKCDLV
tara:strand:- start:335 stop:640 length:306 start_codon:yes stop_codon:yes gene_type:complete